MIERISLNSLKFFYFVAKCGSVTKAAEYLFVTQSAVSKQIYNLEDALNLKLFERKNKSLILTAQGQILFDCCQRVFNQLDDCLVGLKQHQNKPFILSCEPTFSMKWLIPRLSKFKALGHDFDVILLTGGGKLISKIIKLILQFDEMILIGRSIYLVQKLQMNLLSLFKVVIKA